MLNNKITHPKALV